MILCVVTYNIRNALGLDGRMSLQDVADTIAGTGAVIAGLQEVDFWRRRSGLTAQACKLGKLLGMDAVYGPTIRFCGFPRFGNAVLSQYPILQPSNQLLTSSGEPRALMKTEIKIGKISVQFFNTHLGLIRNERLQQVEEIIKLTGEVSGPIILTGDFNADPESEEIKKITAVFRSVNEAGTQHTFPANNPKHTIDYIFYSSHWELLKARIMHSCASDHLPLAAALTLR